MKDDCVMRTANLFKALSDYTRLKIVDSIKESELCVRDIAKRVGISQSLASHQLKKLKDNGIVKVRKDGLISYYSIKDEHVLKIYLNALSHVTECS